MHYSLHFAFPLPFARSVGELSLWLNGKTGYTRDGVLISFHVRKPVLERSGPIEHGVFFWVLYDLSSLDRDNLD